MIQKGIWSGSYQYNNSKIQGLIGFEKTNFEIKILKSDFKSFSGTVTDDVNTGGTAGIGAIAGLINGRNIEFVKQMPIMTFLGNKPGNRMQFNKKSQKIYYTGNFSDDGKIISGQWKTNLEIFWNVLIPIPILPLKGTWSMKLKE